MRRTLLALATAGLSVAAYASPPPGGGPPTPIDVNVTNSVVPVEVSNADPIPVASPIVPLGGLRAIPFTLSISAGGDMNGWVMPAYDSVLTGLLVQIRAGGTSGDCTISIGMRGPGGNPLVSGLVNDLTIRAGESSMLPMIPLPNVEFLAGSKLFTEGANDTDGQCIVSLALHGRAL